MAFLHGTVIKIEEATISQNGHWFTRGILEDGDKTLHDFVIFWDNSEKVRAIYLYDVIDLVGKRDRIEGTFKANYMRDFKTRNYQQNNVNVADPIYRGEDAIQGKKPIEFCMDILGAQMVSDEIKKITGSWSGVLKSEKTRSQYNELLEEMIRIALFTQQQQSI